MVVTGAKAQGLWNQWAELCKSIAGIKRLEMDGDFADTSNGAELAIRVYIEKEKLETLRTWARQVGTVAVEAINFDHFDHTRAPHVSAAATTGPFEKQG